MPVKGRNYITCILYILYNVHTVVTGRKKKHERGETKQGKTRDKIPEEPKGVGGRMKGRKKEDEKGRMERGWVPAGRPGRRIYSIKFD